MKFLKLDKNTLIEEFNLIEKEAIDFVKLSNRFVQISKLNVYALMIFCLFINLPVLLVAYRTVSSKLFLFVSVPSFISFYVTSFCCLQALSCFFTIYFLACFLILKKFKSITLKYNQLYSLRKASIKKLVHFNLHSFDKLLKLFNSCQNDINRNLTAYFSGFAFCAYTFPYFILTANGLFETIVFSIIYFESITFSIFLVIYANAAILDQGVSYFVLFCK